MKHFINKLRNYLSYYRLFGWGGLNYLYQKRFKKDQVIEFSIPDAVHPIKLRNDSSDISAFYQIFYRKDYDLRYTVEPKTILDLGANIGLSVIYFKSRFPDATIIAVEPDPENFRMLQNNTQAYSNVHCLNYGIWNKQAFLEIKDPGFGKWALMLSETDQKSESTVEATSINDILAKFGIDKIDILKIDIEGSEKELFENNYEHWLPLVNTLIIELHDHMRPGCSKSFFKAMANFDFAMYHHGENMVCQMAGNGPNVPY
jgi:FkbM family methyltransferase